MLSFLGILEILKKIGKILLDVLLITIPIPIGVIIIAIGIGWYYKNSEVSKSVKAAITELVAGAELKARDDVIAIQNKLLNSKNKQLSELEKLTKINEETLQYFEEQSEKDKKLIESMKYNLLKSEKTNVPTTDSTNTISPDVFNRLRNQ